MAQGLCTLSASFAEIGGIRMTQYYERPVEFRVSNVFSNHMVLQREKNIHIFGEGKDDTEVEVTLIHKNGNSVKAKSKAMDGKWLAILPPQKAAADVEVVVKAVEDNKIIKKTFTDVVIGEVWLAGGQSNMEFELQNCTGGKEALKNDENCNVRFYYTPQSAYKNKAFYEAEEASSWQTFDEEQARKWSAVGYFFAKKLSQDLDGVTVGVIGCNWGGTSASAWMPKELLLEDAELATYVEEYEQAKEGISIEEQEESYDAYVTYHAEWEQKCAKLYEENPEIEWAAVEEILGKCQWPGPMNVKNPYRPSGLYECMLQRVCPYSLRGFIYYQGESDDHKPKMYYKLFTKMIKKWRNDFMDDELPFLLTQLTMHRYKQDADFKNWPIIREAQMKTYRTVKNSGIAVIIDCGEFNNIHPLNKKTVGERLELQALTQVYHTIEKKQAFGPLYRSCIYHENEIEVCFAYAEEGFVVKGDLSGFEIAGADKEFEKAKARIEGDKIFVFAEGVKDPRYVRYLWTNYSEVSIFGENGIPLAPFCNVSISEV